MGFLSNICSKNEFLTRIFAYSELAWRADLKNGPILFSTINFGNCKQTADVSEMSILRFHVDFVALYM